MIKYSRKPMFTGIITYSGTVRSSRKAGDGLVLSFSCLPVFLDDVKIGDSIAVSGACLTVTSLTSDSFTVDISQETASKTTISSWKTGKLVNLEKSLRPNDRVSGHFVTGHIDGTVRLKSSRNSGEGKILTFECPVELRKMVISKGSVAIDGISLTPIDATGTSFSVAVIPHTLKSTTLEKLEPGAEVNIEIDLFARYVFNLLKEISISKGPLSIEKLKDEGY
jgi:riboflavin synthase